MKQTIGLLSFFAILLLGSAFTGVTNDTEEKINWLSWEEAQELSKTNPKKIYVDVYTDWCGWCKKMDKSTFQDPGLIKYLNENFYAVKFNAEQREEIAFKGHTFRFVPGGRRGAHELAKALLNGRMGYPAFVLLDEKNDRIMISPGYKTADKVMNELVFAKEEVYKESTWQEYQQTLKSSDAAKPKRVIKNVKTGAVQG